MRKIQLHKKQMLWLLTVLWAVLILLTSLQPGKSSGKMSNSIAAGLYETSLSIRDTLNGDAELPEFEGLSEAEIKAHKLDQTATWNAILRNIAHAGSFFVLAMLLLASLHTSLKNKPVRWLVLVTVVICVIFMLINEFLQAFVPGRAAQISDVGLDLLGVTMGIIIVELFFRRKNA